MHAYSENVIFTPERLKQEVEYFLQQDALVFDVETVGQGDQRLVPQVNQVVWLSMATHGRTIVVPMGHPNGNVMLSKPRKKKNRETGKFDMFPATWDAPPDQMRPSEVFEILEPLFFHPQIIKGSHKAVFDFPSVMKYFGGRVPSQPIICTLTQAWLLDENKQTGLKEITERKYKRKYDVENTGRRVEIHPFNKVARYAYFDAKFMWLEYLDNIIDLHADDLDNVYELERETLEVFLDIASEGTPVNIERMKELREIYSERRVRCEGLVYKAAGRQFNLNSNPQKVEIFYGPKKEGNQGLKPWKLTDGGLKKKKLGLDLTINDYSTSKDALEKYINNPVVSAFMDFQEVDRILTGYLVSYLGTEEEPGKIVDGKVYPGFLPYGTVTGRVSCNTPNLQNIPRPDTEMGKEVRSLFIAGDRHKLIVADYGQVELVVLAHFVGRGALYDGFFKGIDPHTMTAAMVFDYDPEEMTHLIKVEEDAEAKKYRQIAKNLNFAIVYGAGPDKVASMSKSTVTNAKKWLSIHERQFPEIYRFKDKAISTMKSRKPPYLCTLEGRKRRLPSIMSRDWGTAGKAERQAINSLIQGSAADIIKVAMVEVNNGLRKQGTGRLLLQVHDELVARAPDADAEAVASVVREGMVGKVVQSMVDVPLSIDLKIVDTWAEAK